MNTAPETTAEAQPTQPRYRLWHIPQIPGSSFRHESTDLGYLVKMQDVLAEYDQFQYENNIKPDYSNASGIEQWDASENDWFEVQEEDFVEILGMSAEDYLAQS